MPVAELHDGRIVLTSEMRERELVKLVPGTKWDTHAQTWWVPLSWASCVQLRAVFGDTLQVGVALADWAKNERLNRIAPCLELRTAEDADLDMPLLRPFQRAGVKFLSTAKQALLADEMGLGKSVQTVMTLETLEDAFPALIVCPNSMKHTWAAEYAKWAPHRKVVVISGSKKQRDQQIAGLRDGDYDIGVINWEGLRGHTRLAGYGSIQLDANDKVPKELNEIEFGAVVADEAHKAKDPRSKQTRALWWIGSQARYRFALTGTPVANSPEDVWSIMHFVAPAEFPTKSKFIERYALQSWNMFGFMEICGLRSETRDELFKILDPRFLRRTKKAVLPQLPDKTYVTREVELAPKQKRAYDQLRKTMLAELDNGILVATNPLTKMTRLLQLASAYGEITEEGNLVLSDPSCKVEALLEIVDELGDQPALVFAESRQLIELAYKHLVRAKPHGPGLEVGMITGNVTPEERAQNVKDFNAGRKKIMLITLGAGGEGLSFPGCSTAIFLQRSFSQVKNLQAEDRVHGIGRGVEGVSSVIIDVVATDTAEERVHLARIEKGEMLEEIARDQETLRAWLSK